MAPLTEAERLRRIATLTSARPEGMSGEARRVWREVWRLAAGMP